MAIVSKIRIYIYNHIVYIYPALLRKFYKMNIGIGTRVSRRANLDKSINPEGIHIGEYTDITGGVCILTHDACRNIKKNVRIGNYCFIGAYSIILPGVSIGNEVIVGAGSVITKNVPDNCIVAGNPAKIIRTEVRLGKWGRLIKPNDEYSNI